ncbi:MAG: outer membrane lipoprotein carrier protein LolA [Schleiferiaceae bacterium]|nr:outer membrane lipoprotein carrier protein LolA [Schleiferiaceae bacterium]MDR9441600.1 outer membrane lipoprotein carrier protein LolA [Schleiferiaceae bacterium]
MRILLALFLLASSFSPATGQPTYKQAKTLLEEASQKMKSYKTVQIDFDYQFANNRVDPPITQTKAGQITLQGDDYRLSMPSMKQLRMGNKLYNILPQDKEVQVTTYQPDAEEGLTPSKILNLFDQGYSYQMGGSETVNGQKVRYVILKPNASESIDKVMVGIQADSKQVHSMKQWGTNGTVTTLTVKEVSPNPDLPQGFFRFDKSDYPGYYIAD